MPVFPRNKAARVPQAPRLAPICRLLVCLALTLSGAAAAWGQSRLPADPRIARLNHAGFKSRGYCTGFVLRGGAVVTAAHCLPAIRGDTVHVLPGYAGGRAARHVHTAATSYRIAEGRDIAVLCGAKGGPDGLRLAAAAPTPGTGVEVRGYGAPRGHALQRTACSVRALPRDGVMRLDCPLSPGTSGAPVTLAGSGDVVGVVSASSATASLAYRLSAGMLARLCR